MLASRIQATEADDQIAQGGEVFRSLSGADGGLILAEGHVPDIMDGIFDGPMTPAENLEFRGAHFVGGAAGDHDFGFLGHAQGFEMMGGAGNHRGLDGVGEAGALRSDLEGINLTGFMPAVALIQSDVRREKKRPLGPGKGW